MATELKSLKSSSLGEIYLRGQDDGIELVFRLFQDEIDANYDGVAKTNAQYLVDKVKWLFWEELARTFSDSKTHSRRLN